VQTTGAWRDEASQPAKWGAHIFAVVKYQPSGLKKYIKPETLAKFGIPNSKIEVTGAHIVDAQGIKSDTEVQERCKSGGTSALLVLYEVEMSEFSPSTAPRTFKCTFVAPDGDKMPLSLALEQRPVVQ
jgi:hypothetical protein